MTTHEDFGATAAPDRHPQILASECGGGSCPTVYATGGETVVVQGYVVDGDRNGVEVPDGERLVEIPTEVLLAAADAIRNRA